MHRQGHGSITPVTTLRNSFGLCFWAHYGKIKYFSLVAVSLYANVCVSIRTSKVQSSCACSIVASCAAQLIELSQARCTLLRLFRLCLQQLFKRVHRGAEARCCGLPLQIVIALLLLDGARHSVNCLIWDRPMLVAPRACLLRTIDAAQHSVQRGAQR